jgi:hypothetical protein
VRDSKDTIYDYVTKMAEGFAAYEKTETIKYSTWDQITAVVAGDITASAFGYGPHLGPQPSNAKFAKIKWTGSATAVGPSFSTVMACSKDPDAFGSTTRQYNPNVKTKDCYPLTLTVNTIFHHSYSNLEVMIAEVALLGAIYNAFKGECHGGAFYLIQGSTVTPRVEVVMLFSILAPFRFRLRNMPTRYITHLDLTHSNIFACL